ncbi:MAG: hypothetical protein L0206_24380, partial [Actinobacteria bacterium]|nr:hypothetical protein [Actinomycetota bacterium]
MDLSAARVPVLGLRSGGGLSQGSAATLEVEKLRVDVKEAMTLGEANDVDTLAVNIADANEALSFTDADGFTVGSVDGLLGVTTNGGAVELTASTGGLTVLEQISAGAGSITLTAGGDDQLLTNQSAITTSDGVTLVADKMDLQAGSTVTGGVVLLRPEAVADAGEAIDLGSMTDAAANTLELSDAELDTVVAATALRVGDPAAGAMTISAPIDPLGTSTLHLITGSGIAGGTNALTETELALEAGTGIQAAPVVTKLAARTQTGPIAVANTGPLTLAAVDGLVGVTIAGGGSASIDVSAASPLTVAAPVANQSGGAITLTAAGDDELLTNQSAVTTAGDVTLIADRMDLQAGSTVSGAVVALRPEAVADLGDAIDLGSMTDTAVNTLELSDAELDTVVAGTLRIGDGTAGPITVSEPIDLTGHAPVLALLSDAGVSQGSGKTLKVGSLRVDVDEAVTLGEANEVDTLAVAIADSGQALSFT